jgi:hypothetical protein
MQQITPSKIFRKTEVASEAATIMGLIIFISIIGYFIYSVF